jgi:hypothetical protein
MNHCYGIAASSEAVTCRRIDTSEHLITSLARMASDLNDTTAKVTVASS